MGEMREGIEDRLRETADRMEQEVRRAVRYLDEEIVPEVRRNSSAALRTVADRLRGLADHLDDERRRHGDGGR